MKRDPNVVACDRANAAADAFRPPDQMRSPRSAATGSRAKRKDHLNVVDNTRSEEQPQSETAGLAVAIAIRQILANTLNPDERQLRIEQLLRDEIVDIERQVMADRHA